jgi:hypothetical protein
MGCVEFDATLRGLDMAIWYTAAWFDRYVKGDPSADERVLTTRWQDDPRGEEIDPNTPPDGNLFSFYLRSRYRITPDQLVASQSGKSPLTSQSRRNRPAASAPRQNRPSARRQHLSLGSGEVSCHDIRAGCPEMAPDGCSPGSYSYLEEALTPDVPGTELDPCAGVQAPASRD